MGLVTNNFLQFSSGWNNANYEDYHTHEYVKGIKGSPTRMDKKPGKSWNYVDYVRICSFFISHNRGGETIESRSWTRFTRVPRLGGCLVLTPFLVFLSSER